MRDGVNHGIPGIHGKGESGNREIEKAKTITDRRLRFLAFRFSTFRVFRVFGGLLHLERLIDSAGHQVHSYARALRTRIPRLRSKSKANSRKPRIMRSESERVITLNQQSKTNESKTAVPGNSGAARRWIMARLAGLARACVPPIEHWRRR